LHEKVPTDIGLFLPEFSTSTEDSKLACMAAFCEAASPYYSYCTLLCGFNRVRIDGTADDWRAIRDHITELGKLLPGLEGYASVVATTITSMLSWVLNDDKDKISKILYTRQCGSGHQLYVYGWFLDFLMGEQKRLERLPTHISVVPFKSLNTGENFKLCHGLFSSRKDEDGFCVPQFSSVVNKVL